MPPCGMIHVTNPFEEYDIYKEAFPEYAGAASNRKETKMKKIIHLVMLSAVIGMILVSCSFPPGGSDSAQTVLPAAQAAQVLADKVSIELSAEYDVGIQYNTVGQVVAIKYRVNIVKNDLTDATPPNVTFTGVSPICPAITTIGNLNDRLETGENFDCTLDYVLTQADLDRGSVPITATVNIYTVNSNTVNTNVTTVPSKALALNISADPTTYYQTAQSITYTYTIKNIGSSQLGPAQFTVTDGLISTAAFNCGNADATIASGATLTCSAKYTITAADMNNASISSNATAAGGGANPSQPVNVSITKTTPPAAAVGVTVQHTVVDGEWLWQIARCYGADPVKTVAANTQLSNAAQLKAGMIVTVPNIGSNGTVHAPPQPCVTKHVVQSGDTWSSIASKYGADPGFTQMVNSNTMIVGKEVKVPLYTVGMNYPLSNSSIPASTTALTLTVTPNPTTYSQAAQVINFTYVITNSGTSTLGPTQFTVTDGLISPTAFNCGVGNTTLAPNATVTCSANYTITQADMGTSSISNSATASGGGAGPSSAISKTITRSVTSLTLDVTPNPTIYNLAGQVITYTYVITNSGTTTLGPAQFTVTDGLISAAPFNCGAADATLVPTAAVTCTANYTITQADMGNASLSNNATALGGGAGPSPAVSKTITRQ